MPAPDPSPAPLRFGVICEGEYLYRWQAECVELLCSAGVAQPVLMLLPAETQPAKRPRWQRWRQYPYKNLLFRLYRRFVFRPRALQRLPWSETLHSAARLYGRLEQRGSAQYLAEDSLEALRSHKLDFILRFGWGILRGGVLTAARWGVWSFHHGDEQQYRGGPAGFWEIFQGNPVTGAMLQQLTEKLDAGRVLYKGWFKTLDHSYESHYNQLLHHSAKWPLSVCRQLLAGAAIIPETAIQTQAPIYRAPGNAAFLRFLWLMLRNKARFHSRQLFRAEIWNIALGSQCAADVLANGINETKARWLPEPEAACYLADPFLFETSAGSPQLLAEHFSYRQQRGEIVRIEAGAARFFPEMPHTVHQSYPYTFRHEGQLYACPERFESGGVDLYRWEEAEQRFVLLYRLLDGFEAVDPSLFFHEGLWWLSVAAREPSNSELHLFYAKNPEGPYLPHAGNPVKTDIASARPAGHIFQLNGKCYRPGQDCSQTYGGALVIHEIELLNPFIFREKAIRRLEASRQSPYPEGLHTLSLCGDQIAFDGKRYTFMPAAFRAQLARKLRRFFRS